MGVVQKILGIGKKTKKRKKKHKASATAHHAEHKTKQGKSSARVKAGKAAWNALPEHEKKRRLKLLEKGRKKLHG